MTDIQSMLLFARRIEIRGISIDPSDKADVILPVTQLANAAGIDFEAASGLIFWSDVNEDAIYKVHRNGSGRELLVKGAFLASYVHVTVLNFLQV